MTASKTSKVPVPNFPDSHLRALASGTHCQPHDCLGLHPAEGAPGYALFRAFHPEAASAEIVIDGRAIAAEAMGQGGFAAVVPDVTLPAAYQVRFLFEGGGEEVRHDPYRFLPTVGEQDLHFLGEGSHREIWQMLGARVRTIDDVEGTAFSVWAPNARRVSVTGHFTHWDGRLLPMRRLGRSGVFELFVPGVTASALYRFEVLGHDGKVRSKADPLARQVERPPATASVVAGSDYQWNDASWMDARRHADPLRRPMTVYEVHLGSWKPELGRSYRAVAHELAEHAKKLGFTHVELLPVTAHPFGGSWGYQTTGYYAAAAQYGDPDELRFLVDTLHQHGLGVLLDWAPAHFPRDEFALQRFDGSALYEHLDPRLGEHPDWGTLIFNYGRNEVRNFLVGSALYWLREMHFDGIRVDAVASMLYRDYSREEGQWLPNEHGGRENLEAVAFLRDLNAAVASEAPGCVTVAEESTAWPGVTAPTAEGGLGFTFKWNMGWMHDSLRYFGRDSLHRRHHQDDITFAAVYDGNENFVLPLSHDEVVHGKGSLLARMPGDSWQRMANLRLLLAWQYLRPGKKLVFMGTELALEQEWNHDHGFDWSAATREPARGLGQWLAELGGLVGSRPSLFEGDFESDGTHWISTEDASQSVIAFSRQASGDQLLIVCNFTPVPRTGYRLGVPRAGRWRLVSNSDAVVFGGSGFEISDVFDTQGEAAHGNDQSLVLTLPPLAAVVLELQS